METSAKKKNESPATKDVVKSAPQDAKRRPVKVIRVSDCSASIWVRGEPNDEYVYFSVTLERSYKGRDGSWKYTRSFDADSLGKVADLCKQVSEFIRAYDPAR